VDFRTIGLISKIDGSDKAFAKKANDFLSKDTFGFRGENGTQESAEGKVTNTLTRDVLNRDFHYPAGTGYKFVDGS